MQERASRPAGDAVPHRDSPRLAAAAARRGGHVFPSLHAVRAASLLFVPRSVSAATSCSSGERAPVCPPACVSAAAALLCAAITQEELEGLLLPSRAVGNDTTLLRLPKRVPLEIYNKKLTSSFFKLFSLFAITFYSTIFLKKGKKKSFIQGRSYNILYRGSRGGQMRAEGHKKSEIHISKSIIIVTCNKI